MNVTPRDEVEIDHRYGEVAPGLAGELGRLYEAAYVGTPQEHDVFYSRDRFAERLAGYARVPGFELVTIRERGELIGYAFGYLLPEGARWWTGLVKDPPEGFTTETGSRTFALCELHVRGDRRGCGWASRAHAELMGNRADQERATVLVRPENPARAAYERWGYRPVGELKPYPDSPTYIALVLDLRDPGRSPSGASPTRG